MRSAVVDLASQPIRNYHPNPGAEGATGLGWSSNSASLHPTFQRDVTGGRTGACYRIVRSSDADARVSSVYIHGASGIFGFRVTPGERVYASAHIRPEQANRGTRVRFTFRDPSDIVANSVPGGLQSAVTDCPAGVYTRIEFSQVVPANAASAIVVFEVMPTGASTPIPGEQVWHDDAMLSKGVTSVAHADGSTPGWRWLGTAGSSESVGYPYTLESIAGAPAAQVTGVGLVQLTLAQMPALAGRTTYVVSDRVALNASGTPATLARTAIPGGAGEMRLSGSGAGQYEFRPQFDGGGGGGGAYTVITIGAPAAGTRNVWVVAQSEGLTAFDQEVNGSGTNGRTGMNAGTGYSTTGSPGLLAQVASITGTTYETPVYAAQFRGYHDAETRKRVTAWLARKYGAPIPAGY